MSNMQANDYRPWGPLSPQEVEALHSVPFGEAKNIIRKHDPLWGFQPGEMKNFKVCVIKEEIERYKTYVTIAAESEEQASDKAGLLPLDDADWQWYEQDKDFWVENVKEI